MTIKQSELSGPAPTLAPFSENNKIGSIVTLKEVKGHPGIV